MKAGNYIPLTLLCLAVIRHPSPPMGERDNLREGEMRVRGRLI